MPAHRAIWRRCAAGACVISLFEPRHLQWWRLTGPKRPKVCPFWAFFRSFRKFAVCRMLLESYIHSFPPASCILQVLHRTVSKTCAESLIMAIRMRKNAEDRRSRHATKRHDGRAGPGGRSMASCAVGEPTEARRGAAHEGVQRGALRCQLWHHSW